VPLHLVEPLGFQVDDAKLKRAGLDYWPFVVVQTHASWEAFCSHFSGLPGPKRLVAFSKKGAEVHTNPGAFRPGDWLLFGSESVGLPEAALRKAELGGGVVRIPISERHVRSLNLAVAAGIGVYEALRQLDAGGGGGPGGGGGGGE